jgi:glycine/D-amino acid oxidase-like deaminating enzyme/nitrite reductase/ring-hydroxylating ferredoxin subunit
MNKLHNKSHEGETLSFWSDSELMPFYSGLHHDLETDVCVIGGGIAGITTAYLLMKEGKKVCLLESFAIGAGQTGKTTAHLTAVLDERFYRLEKYHGVEGAKLAAQSHLAALKKVEEIVSVEKIDCDFEKVSGYLVLDEKSEEEELQKEWLAVQRAGFKGVEYLEYSPFVRYERRPCIYFPDQIQLHPLKYLSALCARLDAGGVQMYTGTPVTQVKESDGQVFVQTKDGAVVTANAVVVATNSPINDVVSIHTKQSPYRSYVVGFRIPKGSVKKALFWDTDDPYHYVRISPSENDEASDILIVGGEDHKTGQEEHPEKCFKRLEEWTRARFPMILNTLYRWSAQVMEPVDGLAFIGHNPLEKNVYIITGASGNGMTYGTLGAMLITDQILARSNIWEKLYQPSRKNLSALGPYVKENANVFAQYGDWLSAKPNEIDDIPRGEGRVIRQGLGLVAAYKDEVGNVEYMSAACPHLEGAVHWNCAEKSWDCPCHGSRFDCHGQVIDGPAKKDLQKIDVTAKTPLTLDLFTEPDGMA